MPNVKEGKIREKIRQKSKDKIGEQDQKTRSENKIRDLNHKVHVCRSLSRLMPWGSGLFLTLGLGR